MSFDQDFGGMDHARNDIHSPVAHAADSDLGGEVPVANDGQTKHALTTHSNLRSEGLPGIDTHQTDANAAHSDPIDGGQVDVETQPVHAPIAQQSSGEDGLPLRDDHQDPAVFPDQSPSEGGQTKSDTHLLVAPLPDQSSDEFGLSSHDNHCGLAEPSEESASDGNQVSSENHDGGVASLADSRDHAPRGNHSGPVASSVDRGEEGQGAVDNLVVDAVSSPICAALRELHRQRQDLHRAEKSLTLQIKAKCRRLCWSALRKDEAFESKTFAKQCGAVKSEADKVYKAMFPKKRKKSPEYDGQLQADTQVIHAPSPDELAVMALGISFPFINARSIVEAERKVTEKRMATEAKKLPVWEWCDQVYGFGVGSLAAIVGETGDIGNYATVSKLWKRLGLAVINGERQRKCTDKEKAIEHGYNPSRRSVMWNVAGSLFKSQSQCVDKETGEIKNAKGGEYRLVYDARKTYEKERNPDMSDGHAHNRAMRYMEKRLVLDLWRAWREFT